MQTSERPSISMPIVIGRMPSTRMRRKEGRERKRKPSIPVISNGLRPKRSESLPIWAMIVIRNTITASRISSPCVSL
ncbi:hypothetical protein SBADM41S_03076 [Streptomyces badius]